MSTRRRIATSLALARAGDASSGAGDGTQVWLSGFRAPDE